METAQDQQSSSRQIKCDVCNVWCSGNISYQNHVEGRPHYIALQKKNGEESGSNNGTGNGTDDAPPTKKMRKSSGLMEVVRCDICDLEVTKDAYEAHVKGVRHSRQIKEKEVAPEVSAIPHIVEVPGRGYRCAVCRVDMSSKVVVLSHLKGLKHQKRLVTPAQPPPAVGDDKPPNERIECKVCNIFVNSPHVLKQHESSAKHKHKAGLAAKRAAEEAAKLAALEKARQEGKVGQAYDAWDPQAN